MSYTSYLLSQPFKLPTGTVALLAGLAYVKVYLLQPPLMYQEISKAEWNATPQNYLQHPEHHATAFPKVPGLKNIPDGKAELAHKLHPSSSHH